MSFWNNLYEGQISEKDGKFEGRGLGAFLLQQVVDEDAIEADVQKRKNQQQAVALGEDYADLNLPDTASLYDVQGAVAKKRRARASADSDKAHTRSMELPLAQLKASTDATNAQLELTRETNETARLDSNNQFALQYERMLQQDKRANEARLDELAYRRAQDLKEDRRYNDQIDRENRRHREASINTLVAGLANLGAAFAF